MARRESFGKYNGEAGIITNFQFSILQFSMKIQLLIFNYKKNESE